MEQGTISSHLYKSPYSQKLDTFDNKQIEKMVGMAQSVDLDLKAP